MDRKLFALPALCMVLFACAAIPRASLKQVDREITYQDVAQDPDRYKGKVILAGGQIISTDVQPGETWVKVLQHPLDWRQKPKNTDVSYGRFLVRFPGFADPAVYAPGKDITVVGEVEGKKVLPIGGMDYSYPELIPRDQVLWNPETGGGPLFQFGIGIGGVFR